MPKPVDASELLVTVLGTGTSQGIPVIGCVCPVCTSSDPRDRRLRTSVMLSLNDTSLLVDVGPDFRQQMLTNGFDRVDAILLTHEHNDHISGLDDVRPLNFRYQKDMPVYGLPRVLEALRRRFDYVFDPKYSYPGLPKIRLVELHPGPACIAGVDMQVISVQHGELPVLGFRVGSFCYITDAKIIPEDQVEYLSDLDVLVINALHRREHFSHLNLDEALELIDVLSPGVAYLTHLSHDMGTNAEVSRMLPENVNLAHDGLQIRVTL